MSLEEAQQIVTERRSLRFDYLRGRVMKVDLSEDEFDDWLYDRDNGHGAAAKAITSIQVKTDNVS
jgi:sarcosine oxidase delta subunit